MLARKVGTGRPWRRHIGKRPYRRHKGNKGQENGRKTKGGRLTRRKQDTHLRQFIMDNTGAHGRGKQEWHRWTMDGTRAMQEDQSVHLHGEGRSTGAKYIVYDFVP